MESGAPPTRHGNRMPGFFTCRPYRGPPDGLVQIPANIPPTPIRRSQSNLIPSRSIHCVVKLIGRMSVEGGGKQQREAGVWEVLIRMSRCFSCLASSRPSSHDPTTISRSPLSMGGERTRDRVDLRFSSWRPSHLTHAPHSTANSRLGQAVPQSSLLPPTFSTLIGSRCGSESFVKCGAPYRQTQTRRFNPIRRGSHYTLLAGAMLAESGPIVISQLRLLPVHLSHVPSNREALCYQITSRQAHHRTIPRPGALG